MSFPSQILERDTAGELSSNGTFRDFVLFLLMGEFCAKKVKLSNMNELFAFLRSY